MLLPSVEDGYLPYYLLFTAVMATAHSLVCYISPPASSMAGFRGPASPEPTLLQAHIYGVKNLYTTLMRGYAAYHIHDEVAYRLAMWSYVGVLLLYGSEVFVWKTVQLRHAISTYVCRWRDCACLVVFAAGVVSGISD